MRRLTWTALLVGFASLTLALAGCDVDSDDDTDGTNGGTDTMNGMDTNGGNGTQWYSVLIIDDAGWTCSNIQKAHGADIDAVELDDGAGGSLGFWDSVVASYEFLKTSLT